MTRHVTEAQFRSLRIENRRLRERIIALECAQGIGEFIAPPEWLLTPKEAHVLGELLSHEVCTKDGLMTSLYGDDLDNEPEIKILDVFVCHLRKKIAAYGIQIITVWGIGYRMDDEAKALVRSLAPRRVLGAAASRIEARQ